ncbi:unnamed protein product [Rotaria sordida]|uniref:NAD(P)(+)--arginine ADP-ribosyltransferase n=1 Tax=Rotaria sordida TaxID=392033 RepID=A0A815ELZ4_9BILA|nr:unnamed protein product [Rotaria sordida]CAF4088297.1 unnamed protein product [Rotaria sordida]
MVSINDDMVKRLEARSYDIFQEPLTPLTPICIHDQKSIISLEQAVEPLISILPNLQTFVLIAKEKCENPSDGLTQDESASIMLYSMDWQPMEQCLYYVLNAILRCNDREKLKPWLLYLTLFIRALSRLPSISVIVYRQVQIGLTERYPIEKTFIWWTFSLCTLFLDIFQSNEYLNKTNTQTIFTIESHSGKDIRKHSFYSNEDQILLMAASEFKVISSIKQSDNQYIIYLKEIQSNNSLLQYSNISNEQEILSASLLLNISNTNIQSRSRIETMQKYINRTLKIQNKIEQYAKYSSIELINENLDDQDISFIIQHAIIKKQCTVLRLDNNYITSEGITILVNSLYNNNTLIELNLYSNRLYDKGLYPFVKLLSDNYSVLQKLHLGSNRISNEGVQLLAEILKTNTTLTVLCLDSNRISDEGVHFLANTLIHHNKTLQELSLKGSKFITSLSVPYFIDILQNNQSLTRFDISNCSLTKEDNQRLQNMSNGNEHFILLHDTEEADCVIF